ncbi:MAG: hypothetical protein DRP71_03000 [Verrucomicrobia bacterium]|nr:MAG: hypothetical protein DRP71_03000 [Verrucomicrobiota bacterium]
MGDSVDRSQRFQVWISVRAHLDLTMRIDYWMVLETLLNQVLKRMKVRILKGARFLVCVRQSTQLFSRCFYLPEV